MNLPDIGLDVLTYQIMKNTTFTLAIILLSIFSIENIHGRSYNDPVDYVNILMGTQSEFERPPNYMAVPRTRWATISG